MPCLPRHVTPARIAALAAVALVLALLAPALTGFYVALIATAAMLGAAFAAYLAVVDEPAEWAVFELGTCAVAALLTLAGTSLRFPDVVCRSSWPGSPWPCRVRPRPRRSRASTGASCGICATPASPGSRAGPSVGGRRVR
jgi:uncharacterized membrane protein YgcG